MILLSSLTDALFVYTKGMVEVSLFGDTFLFCPERGVFVPNKSLKPCKYPCCPQLTNNSYCDEHKNVRTEKRKQYDKDRPEYFNWYNSARYRESRLKFLFDNPFCSECEKAGKFTPSLILDHIIPHKGDYNLFWNPNNWGALCKICHDRKTCLFDGGFSNRIKK